MTSKEIITHSPIAFKAYRESIDISVTLLAQKTSIAKSKLFGAETKSNVFTLKQLKTIADALMVSDVQLVLDEVSQPKIPDIVDHRNQSYFTDEEQTYQLNKLIRQVHQDRDNLLDIYEMNDEESQTFTLNLTGDDAIADAHRIREFLKVGASRLTVDGSDYYRAWRALLAQMDVLVIEKPRLKIGSEGMALFYEEMPVIVILTSGQCPSRRLFTMMHELVHLGLRKSCIDGKILNDKKTEETYCNRVAGHVLVPEHIVSDLYNEELSVIENIVIIRKKTHASKQAVAIQLKILGLIDQCQLSDFFASQEVQSKTTSFGTKKKNTVYNQYGQDYLQQVFGAVWQGGLNITTAMSMLGLKKMTDFSALQEKVFK